nr:hypothetical protein [Haloferax volcanii]
MMAETSTHTIAPNELTTDDISQGDTVTLKFHSNAKCQILFREFTVDTIKSNYDGSVDELLVTYSGGTGKQYRLMAEWEGAIFNNDARGRIYELGMVYQFCFDEDDEGPRSVDTETTTSAVTRSPTGATLAIETIGIEGISERVGTAHVVDPETHDPFCGSRGVKQKIQTDHRELLEVDALADELNVCSNCQRSAFAGDDYISPDDLFRRARDWTNDDFRGDWFEVKMANGDVRTARLRHGTNDSNAEHHHLTFVIDGTPIQNWIVTDTDELKVTIHECNAYAVENPVYGPTRRFRDAKRQVVDVHPIDDVDDNNDQEQKAGDDSASEVHLMTDGGTTTRQTALDKTNESPFPVKIEWRKAIRKRFEDYLFDRWAADAIDDATYLAVDEYKTLVDVSGREVATELRDELSRALTCDEFEIGKGTELRSITRVRGELNDALDDSKGPSRKRLITGEL